MLQHLPILTPGVYIPDLGWPRPDPPPTQMRAPLGSMPEATRPRPQLMREALAFGWVAGRPSPTQIGYVNAWRQNRQMLQHLPRIVGGFVRYATSPRHPCAHWCGRRRASPFSKACSSGRTGALGKSCNGRNRQQCGANVATFAYFDARRLHTRFGRGSGGWTRGKQKPKRPLLPDPNASAFRPHCKRILHPCHPLSRR